MSFLKKKIHSLLNRPQIRKEVGRPISFDESISIGILFSWRGQQAFDEIAPLLKELSDSKKTSLLCYNQAKEQLPEHLPSVNDDDLTTLGKLESSHAKIFTDTSFDFLFHLDFELHEITQSILANSNAKYRLGIYSEVGKHYYEMMIGIDKNAGMRNFAEQLLKYAKNIR